MLLVVKLLEIIEPKINENILFRKEIGERKYRDTQHTYTLTHTCDILFSQQNQVGGIDPFFI